ncbi:Maf family protein [Candidatus Dependentiae bacterium]
MTKDILYLGSKSKPRRKLLELSQIDYKILEHKSDECGIDIKHDFDNYVLSIAQEKMDHLVLPDVQKIKEDFIFVLTADTLVKSTKSNQILCKPKDLNDAKRMLTILYNEPVRVVTGCCLEKKILKSNEWETEEKQYWTTDAIVEFCVEPKDFDKYFCNLPDFIYSCSAGIIEGYGQSFFKSINGSYTTVLGLPLYQLRQKLKEMGFKF